MSETVEIWRPGPTALDAYNNPIPGPLRHIGDVDMHVAPAHGGASPEPIRDAAPTEYTLYRRGEAPSGIQPTDSVKVRRVMHHVDGEPRLWYSHVTGEFVGEQITVRRVDQ